MFFKKSHFVYISWFLVVSILSCHNMISAVLQTELISGDQNGNIRVQDLTANSCSCELVPEVDTAVRSLTVMWDGSLVVAANNHGTCYVWRLMRGTQNIFLSGRL
ncbi:hypothetical protein ACOSQ2_006299 [Xanthoceras sorbifolium]